MVAAAPAAGSIESWLRQSPAPMYRDDPHDVLAAAHDAYGLTTDDPVSYGVFVSHLWARGVEPRQAGTKFWLVFGG